MRIFLSIIFSLTLFLTSIPKADALVGLAISSRTAKSVGGLMSVAGAGSVATGITLTAIFGNAYAFLALSVLGATTGIIGIVVLDEKSAELKFSALDPEKAKMLGISEKDLQIFNSEIEELNVVKEDIESRMTKKTTEKEVIELWKVGQEYLAPETLQVAARIISAAVDVKK